VNDTLIEATKRPAGPTPRMPEQPSPEPVPRAGPWAGRLPALDFTSILPERSAQDILAAEVHMTFGRRKPTTYTLPVLSIAENREWKAKLELGLVGLLSSLDDVGDDLGGVLSAFSTVTPQLTQALYDYDVDGVLPEQAVLERVASDAEVLRAVLAVWAAANPFAQVAVAAMREAEPEVPATAAPPTNGSSTPTNTARPPTAGRRRTSSRH
jgi:hypothetical protein